MIAVGPDPMTGLLTKNFIFYYGVSDLSTGAAGSLMMNDINGTLGIVSVQDPIHTVQVRQPTNTKKPPTLSYTRIFTMYFLAVVTCTCFVPI